MKWQKQKSINLSTLFPPPSTLDPSRCRSVYHVRKIKNRVESDHLSSRQLITQFVGCRFTAFLLLFFFSLHLERELTGRLSRGFSCNRQISRYHCPTCNLPYCSLGCYKSPQHEDCSEKFDRQSLLDEIRSAEGKSSEEKKAMLEMLKRFEEENAELEQGEEDDEARDLERQELEKRLEGVDLGEYRV